MRWNVIVISVLLLALPARAEVQSPEEVMHEFYTWVLAHPSRALPSSRERARLANFLSPHLMQLLKEASDTQAQCVNTAPKGEKPDIIEGDLFVGNYEGATEVAYGAQHRDGDAVYFESDLLYIDTRFPKGHERRAVAWKDRLDLQSTGTRWFVQDVKFPQGRSLAAGLKEYVADGSKSCGKS